MPTAPVNPIVICTKAYALLDGDSYSIIAPECNTAAMNELLQGLSEAYPREDIVLFADNAGWHKSKALLQPANIRIELLPPYSPQLNAVEHLWDYIREQKDFNNHLFESLDQLEDHLESVLKELHHQKEYIQFLCSFHWMLSPP